MAEPLPPAGAPPPAVPPGYDAPREARRLLRSLRSGSLATLDPGGAAFASLVSVATMPDGSPILLLSRLAAHTRHIDADPRCALLLARGGKGDPLAHPRLTLTGTARRIGGEGLLALARDRFLRRQPKAALYADFPDFSLFLLEIAAAHLNGGFARAATLDAPALRSPAPDALVALEASAVAHMNADHMDALALYATRLAGCAPGDWTASGLDAEGIDLICGDRTARVIFDAPVESGAQLRQALKELAQRARSAENPPPG